MHTNNIHSTQTKQGEQKIGKQVVVKGRAIAHLPRRRKAQPPKNPSMRTVRPAETGGRE